MTNCIQIWSDLPFMAIRLHLLEIAGCYLCSNADQLLHYSFSYKGAHRMLANTPIFIITLIINCFYPTTAVYGIFLDYLCL